MSLAASRAGAAPWGWLVAYVTAIADRFNAWYAEQSETRLYDILLRFPAILFFILIGQLQLNALIDVLTRDHGLSPLVLAAAIAARCTSLALVVVFASLTVMRAKPVARAKGLRPRLAAVLGTSFGFCLSFTARAEPSLYWDLASTLLGAVGAMATVLVVLRLGRSFSTMAEARRLVTEGPYRFVRHPLYMVEEIALLGVFLQYRSWPAALILVMHFALQVERMRNEEKVLAESFPEYRDYARRTSRILPGIY